MGTLKTDTCSTRVKQRRWCSVAAPRCTVRVTSVVPSLGERGSVCVRERVWVRERESVGERERVCGRESVGERERVCGRERPGCSGPTSIAGPTSCMLSPHTALCSLRCALLRVGCMARTSAAAPRARVERPLRRLAHEARLPEVLLQHPRGQLGALRRNRTSRRDVNSITQRAFSVTQGALKVTQQPLTR